jgi:hypothetical protein
VLSLHPQFPFRFRKQRHRIPVSLIRETLTRFLSRALSQLLTNALSETCIRGFKLHSFATTIECCRIRRFGGQRFIEEPTISRSSTKSVDLRVAPERAFDFLNEPTNRPKWAVVNMKSVKPAGTDGWHETETRQGKGRLGMRSNKILGILDHLWKDPQASWTVPARIIANGLGRTFPMTFFQPPVLDDRAFDAAGKEVDLELNKSKEILEQSL